MLEKTRLAAAFVPEGDGGDGYWREKFAHRARQ